MHDDDNDDARAKNIVGSLAPTRGRLQFSVYDPVLQQYRAIPRSGMRFRIRSLGEFQRLAQQIADTVAARTWKDSESGPRGE